jgi:hypothetical protein
MQGGQVPVRGDSHLHTQITHNLFSA